MPSIRQRFHLSPCSDFRSHFCHPTYDVCYPNTRLGEALNLKLAIRVSLLVIWLAAGSMVLANELIVTALISATVALIVPIIVIGWWGDQATTIRDRRVFAGLTRGSEISR